MLKRNFRLIAVLLLFATIVVGAIAIYRSREQLPQTVRIATGSRDSLYYAFWSKVAPHLERHTGRPVELRVTSGSVENRRLLAEGEVELAMVQGDVLLSDNGPSDVRLQIVAPLFPEALHVICRADDEPIQTLVDLSGRSVYIGAPNSGSHVSAQRLLLHFHVSANLADGAHDERDFGQLLRDGTIDAAIIVSGTQNPLVVRILSSGDFKLLSVPEAQGLAARSAQLEPFELPMGIYSGAPRVPQQTVHTAATTAFLAIRADSPDGLVRAAMPAIYEHGLRAEFAVMIPRQQALAWCPVEPHASARSYFDPVDHVGTIAAMMESIAATKELLFALGAGLFFLWQWRHRRRRRARQQLLKEEKDRLDALLNETLEIEARHMTVSDPAVLQSMLDEVTRIKLRALHELTEEELLADQAFSIFLIQCANLINKIQLKIIAHSGDRTSAATASRN